MIELFYRIANVDSSLCLPLFELRFDLNPSPSVKEMKWRLDYLPHTIAMPYQLQLQLISNDSETLESLRER